MLVEGYASLVLIEHNSDLTFIENHASFTGGAIHVSNRGSVTYCFMRPVDLEKTGIVHFYDNTAGFAGSTIWGADLGKENCETLHLDIHDHDANNTLSVISSSLQHICLCDPTISCVTEINAMKQGVFPGQDFHIKLALAGESGGLLPGQIRAELKSASQMGTTLTLGTLQNIQELSKAQCTTLTYTFLFLAHDSSVQEDIHLELSALDSTSLESPVQYQWNA